MYNNKLIYGKDLTEKIVCIEHSGDNMVLFIQTESGKIQQKLVPATFWYT